MNTMMMNNNINNIIPNAPRPLPWQNEVGDRTDRIEMIKSIVVELRKKKPDGDAEWQNKLPSMAKKLEENLYRAAPSKEHYKDLATLKARLQSVAMRLGAKPSVNGGATPRSESPSTAIDHGTSSSSIGLTPAPSPPPPGDMKKEESGVKIENAPQDLPPPSLNSAVSGQAPGSAPVINNNPTNPQQQRREPPTESQKLNALRQQQQRLLFLRHASKCQFEAGKCPYTQFCGQMKGLWSHIAKCKDTKCATPHCISSRYVLSHYHKCQDKACQVCAPVRQAIKKQGLARPPAEGESMSKRGRFGASSAPKKIPSIENIKETSTSSLVNFFHKDQIHTHINNLRLLGSPVFSTMMLKMHLLPILTTILNTEYGWLFGKPVDPIALNLPDYTKIIRKPMDLGTVQKRLQSGFYKDPDQFCSDVRLTFENATTFNPIGSDVNNLAKDLRALFEREFEKASNALNRERNKRSEEYGDPTSKCGLCMGENLLFDPQVFYCNGTCRQKIKKNAFYFTNRENKVHYCVSCYQDLASTFSVDGLSEDKRSLTKKKNQSSVEEPWVACDYCDEWVHMICGLFNGRKNDSKEQNYTCPKCIQRAMEHNNTFSAFVENKHTARELPINCCSSFIETRCRRRVQHEMEMRAAGSGVSLDSMERVPEFHIRIVANYRTAAKVKPQLRQYLEAQKDIIGETPAEFPYTNKTILLFQNIDGVDVLMYAMYVHEYGANCPAPNNRIVYISYLDSVKYFQPPMLRTIVFQEIIAAYFEYCKKQGFIKAYIWACPPLKGDDYILFCHPEEQKTPKAERLRNWYISISDDCTKEGVVVDRTNFHEEHMCLQPGMAISDTLEVTRCPYLDGDYWPAVAEDIVTELNKEANKGVSANNNKELVAMKARMTQPLGHKKGLILASRGKALKTNKLRSKGGRDEEGGTQRTPLLERLSDLLKPMKEDFLVLNFYHTCKSCHLYLSDVDKYYKCSIRGEQHPFDLCVNCFNEDSSKDGDMRGIPQEVTPVPFVVPEEEEKRDPLCRSAFFDTRQSYLALCQGNHYQFDQMRRAKHSSMMTLYHLHNPKEPSFIHTCNTCLSEITVGTRYHCDVCNDFDVCDQCYARNPKPHIHDLTGIFLSNRPTMPNNPGSGGKTPGERQKALHLHLRLLSHASICQESRCTSDNCAKMKQLLKHGGECNVRATGGCNICRRIWALLQMHSKGCNEPNCLVPRCKDLKQHFDKSRTPKSS